MLVSCEVLLSVSLPLAISFVFTLGGWARAQWVLLYPGIAIVTWCGGDLGSWGGLLAMYLVDWLGYAIATFVAVHAVWTLTIARLVPSRMAGGRDGARP